jgi:hypothetical protein
MLLLRPSIVLRLTREIWVRLCARSAGLFSHLYRGISAVWIPGATEEMARPSFEWEDSFRICHDGEIW